MNNLDVLKDVVKKMLPNVLELHGVIQPAKTRVNGYLTYICPLCGNGSGNSGDGLVVYENTDGYSYHCYRQGCHFDNIALLALYYGLDSRRDFVEILRRAANDFGIACDIGFSYQSPIRMDKYSAFTSIKNNKSLAQVYSNSALAQDSEKEKELAAIIASDITQAQKHLQDIPIDDRRGLTLTTLKYFGCGYLDKWQPPKLRLDKKSVPTTRRIIIPTSMQHYTAVALDSDRAKKIVVEERAKIHAKTSGDSAIFGAKTITKNTEYLFVTEGECDAMAIWQAYHYEKGFLLESMQIFGVDSAETEDGEIIAASSIVDRAYIATGGAAKIQWISELDKICQQLGITPKIIIALDNDDAGRTNAENHKESLIKLGYPTITKFLKARG